MLNTILGNEMLHRQHSKRLFGLSSAFLDGDKLLACSDAQIGRSPEKQERTGESWKIVRKLDVFSLCKGEG
jgi:hypothetical protein